MDISQFQSSCVFNWSHARDSTSRFVGWLVGWSVGWSVYWLFGCTWTLLINLVHFLSVEIGKISNFGKCKCGTDGWTNGWTDRPTNQPTDGPTRRPIELRARTKNRSIDHKAIHERDDTSVLVSLGELFYMIIGTTVLSHGLSMEKTRRTLECFIMFKPKQYLQPLVKYQTIIINQLVN